MHPAALLDLASGLIRELGRFEQPADRVVAAYFRRHHALGPRERRALADTAYAMLRRRALWLHLAQGGTGALERRLAILAWQGNDEALRAALDASEQEWRDRMCALDAAGFGDALRHNLPDWIAAALRHQLGEDEFPALVAALDQPAPLDLRINPARTDRDAAQRELAAAGIAAQPTPYSPWGLRLAGKPALEKLPLFARGAIEVQDEGSQLLALLTDARRGETVVDFCAGSGGKTLALGAAMRSTGRLYAFDTSGHRLAALVPRLARSGLANVHRMQIAHERDDRIARLAGKVDRVLVDAPCSGLGTLRRHPDLKWRLSPRDVAENQARQHAILAAAARLARPGARLVYATCSLLREENEDVAAAFTSAHPDFEPLPAADLLARARVARAGELVQGPYLRLWPHRHGTDGFFAAAWHRR